MSEIAVALGSNIDEPLQQLSSAYQHLVRHPDITPVAASRVYLSPPHGPQDQPDFHNAVISLRSSLPPEALLAVLLSTECAMGRQRKRHWGERCIDLDLIAYGEVQLSTKTLVLPHPRAHERRFVLDPLIEVLGSEYILPGRGSLRSLKPRCAEQAIRVLCEFPR